MGGSVLQSLLLFVIIHSVYSVYVPYDCRRYSQVCGTAPSLARCVSGKCECADNTFTGFDCTLRTDFIVPVAACNVSCPATAICYAVNGDPVHKCYCDAATYGTNCQLNRVSVTCAANSMVARVFPQSFTGQIYVSDLRGACSLEPAADGNGLLKNITFNEDITQNPCAPNLSVGTNNVDGTKIFTYDITVQYSSFYINFLDEVHTVTCRDTLNGPLLGTVIGVDGGPIDGVTIEGRVNVIDFDVVRDRDDVSVVKNNIVVGIGEEISLQIIVDAKSRYNNHLVENCAAYNVPLEPPVNSDRLEKTLVQDGCPANGSLDAVRGPIVKNGNVISVRLSAFKFLTGELYLYCSVRVCELATDELCLPTDCTRQYGGPGRGYGRKKRQAEEDETIEVQKRIFVVSSAEMKESAEGLREIIEQSCLRSTAFLAITGVFATLLIIVLSVAVTIVVKFHRREKNYAKGKYTDKS